jgi:hypothetical protein
MQSGIVLNGKSWADLWTERLRFSTATDRQTAAGRVAAIAKAKRKRAAKSPSATRSAAGRRLKISPAWRFGTSKLNH